MNKDATLSAIWPTRSEEVRRWVVGNTLVGAGVVNLLLGALVAWLTARRHVPTWPRDAHSPSIFTDTIGTLFVLPLLTCVIVTAGVRYAQRRQLFPAIVDGGPIGRLHARMPATPWRRGLIAGTLSTLALGPPAVVLLALLHPSFGTGTFVLYHAVLSAALGMAITPALALLALLDAPPIRDRRHPSAADAAALEIATVSKRFLQGENEVIALDGIDLTIAQGSFVAIMGPSGSGKSTLLHICGALDNPTSGSVSVAGVPLATLDERGRTSLRREHIGFVFQFFNLLPTLTALENVVLAGLISGQPREESVNRARELLSLVAMADRAAHLPGQMSAGQQQRIAIARALYHRPTLLLADEPTGSLDADSAHAVLSLLRGLADDGQTVVMITHNPDAARQADRIIHLRSGRCVEDEPAKPVAVLS